MTTYTLRESICYHPERKVWIGRCIFDTFSRSMMTARITTAIATVRIVWLKSARQSQAFTEARSGHV
ncbi:hypothetical protein [Chamaesiphon polymorphus]|uniref:hypothetical protein n=1 Tax=Chamaesiphon polymorphus TaxID=2107691 RepID=UPI0015E6FF6B|nr:hypothetical protein [Chamaesiphon polymorphus]